MILIMAFAASKDYENKIIVCELCYINILPLALKKKEEDACYHLYIYVYERNFKAIYALLFET